MLECSAAVACDDGHEGSRIDFGIYSSSCLPYLTSLGDLQTVP